MPVQRCQEDGEPGFKWGEEGKCYTYEPGNAQSRRAARAAAKRQGRAIRANQTNNGSNQ